MHFSSIQGQCQAPVQSFLSKVALCPLLAVGGVSGCALEAQAAGIEAQQEFVLLFNVLDIASHI